MLKKANSAYGVGVWRSIRIFRPSLVNNIRIQVGNGRNTSYLE